MNAEVFWHDDDVLPEERFARNGHRGLTVWFTGLSGSGKSTLANALVRRLFDLGLQAISLDADNLRHGINSDLGFSDSDRTENIRRIGEIATLMSSVGNIVCVSAVSPFRIDRDAVRTVHEVRNLPFMECYVATSLAECQLRDTKGLYERAKSGEVKGLTGVDAPYEEPLNPDITLHTEGRSVEGCVNEILPLVEAMTQMPQIGN